MLVSFCIGVFPAKPFFCSFMEMILAFPFCIKFPPYIIVHTHHSCTKLSLVLVKSSGWATGRLVYQPLTAFDNMNFKPSQVCLENNKVTLYWSLAATSLEREPLSSYGCHSEVILIHGETIMTAVSPLLTSC